MLIMYILCTYATYKYCKIQVTCTCTCILFLPGSPASKILTSNSKHLDMVSSVKGHILRIFSVNISHKTNTRDSNRLHEVNKLSSKINFVFKHYCFQNSFAFKTLLLRKLSLFVKITWYGYNTGHYFQNVAIIMGLTTIN